MKHVALVIGWSVITCVTFVMSVSTIQLMLQKKPIAFDRGVLSATTSDDQIGYYLDNQTGIKSLVETQDSRVDIIQGFLERHKSPLTPSRHYAEFIVSTADIYNVDYRLIPAIMMQESNLCKSIPEGSYNCLGFGIHSRGTLMFENYEASIERATRELKQNYIDKGLTTPELIMTKYTPHSPNGAWANSVNQWIAEMEYNDRTKGKQEKTDADLLFYTEK